MLPGDGGRVIIGNHREFSRGDRQRRTSPHRYGRDGYRDQPSSLTIVGFPRLRGHVCGALPPAQPADKGLMAPINVIPECRRTRSRCRDQPGTPRRLNQDGNGDRCSIVTPFPGFEGTPSVAMADVNGDMILDLVVGTGPGTESQVVAYDGNDSSQGRFTAELARFNPFDAGFTGGVAVAGADSTETRCPPTSSSVREPGSSRRLRCSTQNWPTTKRRGRGVLHLHPVSGFEVRCHTRHRDGGARLGPRKHRHRTGRRRCAADQNLPVRPLQAHRAGSGQRHGDPSISVSRMSRP